MKPPRRIGSRNSRKPRVYHTPGIHPDERFKRSFTKLWGLKKLHEIAKGLHGVAYVSPHKVYASENQYRPNHERNMPRILLRGDEVAKQYHYLHWPDLPRINDAKAGDLSVPQRIREVINRSQPLGPLRLSRSRILMHPTKPTSEMHFEGEIRWRWGKLAIRFFRHIGDKEKSSIKDERYRSDWTGKKWKVEGQQGTVSISEAAFPAEAKLALRHALRVLQSATKQHQIKLIPSREYSLRFVTWKDNPSLLELHDLMEYRDTRPTTKKVN